MRLLLGLLVLAASCNRVKPAKTTKENPKDQLTYIWIAPGTFMMGCSPGDVDCSNDEKPTHQVTITHGFWISDTEVTWGAYERVTGKKSGEFRPAFMLPVNTITWDDAQGFCQAVGMRLPTEAEWEYAARGGNTSARFADLGAVAWYSGNARGTQEVAQKKPNGLGLYDALGNVYEWTADWYDAHYYDGRAVTDPKGPANGHQRVIRGGSYFSENIRVSERNSAPPDDHNDRFGFRCAGITL